ncbi:hypothetical protein MN116_004375 [Schistosoma mekongi]|uniref:Uncharacterized protein n=1 Tax=Schistosoma mekongi TaxID=38744 RepID=A0AAE2D6E5_SCHME|nr:hypothetical protein MN116_004375 [Schistosoma mekongi]
MTRARKSVSSHHPSDRFSKKHICIEDGSVLVVSKKMKNVIKRDLKTMAATDMLVDDPDAKASNLLAECSADILSKRCSTMSSDADNNAMHRIIKKVPHKRRRKCKLRSQLSRNQNLKSILHPVKQLTKTGEAYANQQSIVRFSTGQPKTAVCNKKSKTGNSRSQHSKVNNNHIIKEKRPLSINVLNSFRSLLQQF